MNRPFLLLQRHAFLLACILAMGIGVCSAAPDGALCIRHAWADTALEAQADSGQTEQAEGADATQGAEDKAEESDKAEADTPVSAEQVLAFLGDKRFALGGVELSFDKSQLEKIRVVIADGEVWVLDASDEEPKTIRAIEDKLVKACVECLEKTESHLGGARLQGSGLEKRVQAAIWDKLCEVRAYTLAHALMFYDLAPTEGGAPGEQDLKGARIIEVPASPLSVRLHWVILPASTDDGQGAEAATDAPAQKEATQQEQDSKPAADASAPEAPATSAAPADTAQAEQPAEPEGIQVEPSAGADQPAKEPVWVVDKAAWDETVVASEAWEEQVWVPKQEWVANNVWVQDSPAWDEQVLVHDGYYMNVADGAYYQFKADGFITFDDDEMVRHIKELIANDQITNYEVKINWTQVWQEPEYETVHHDETGHWEDQGSYQDNGHYETVYHEAQYTTVHHDEEGHWE